MLSSKHCCEQVKILSYGFGIIWGDWVFSTKRALEVWLYILTHCSTILFLKNSCPACFRCFLLQNSQFKWAPHHQAAAELDDCLTILHRCVKLETACRQESLRNRLRNTALTWIDVYQSQFVLMMMFHRLNISTKPLLVIWTDFFLPIKFLKSFSPQA